MQQMLVTTRYAYTDIIAITGHFREKLGQGGYGSVYKGVLLPGGVPIAVKMLGSSSCNGEEFISNKELGCNLASVLFFHATKDAFFFQNTPSVLFRI